MSFRSFSAFVAAGLLLAALSACSGPARESVAEGEFRSIIRLWPSHHLDETLEGQLVEAFKEYPRCCDEVWFCVEDDYRIDSVDRAERRRKLDKAASDMRALGIIPSLQTVTIGHPNPEAVASADTNIFGYRAMTGADGVRCATQTCPRDTAFLNMQAEYHAYYSRTLQPDNIFIDDDLRITQHYPAESICFCDSCIAGFNREYGHSYSREGLVRALVDNDGDVRRNWIAFSQESIAMVGRYIAREVHKVSPATHLGLQHVNFHFNLLEGWDWNRFFDAVEEETGLSPVSRPGHGFYNDHNPRQMIEKAYGISRQIARLSPSVSLIAPEIEGYLHKSTGKSPQSLCTETLLYLGMGANSMSYAIICANQEPMQWYADNYFKALDTYHSLFQDYVSHNRGTAGGGIGSFISPDHVTRDVRPGESEWAWTSTRAGDCIFELAPLGLPFTPEASATTATVLDLPALLGMSDSEISSLMAKEGIVMDAAAWNEVSSRNIPGIKPLDVPEGLSGVSCFESPEGRRIVVLPVFTSDVNNAGRLNILRIFDWASEGKMRVVLESPAQAVLVPRVSEDGSLRSVIFLNATISDLPSATLRLRDCPAGSRFVWKSGGNRDIRLKAEADGEDYIVTLPAVKAWDAGWIKITD